MHRVDLAQLIEKKRFAQISFVSALRRQGISEVWIVQVHFFRLLKSRQAFFRGDPGLAEELGFLQKCSVFLAGVFALTMRTLRYFAYTNGKRYGLRHHLQQLQYFARQPHLDTPSTKTRSVSTTN